MTRLQRKGVRGIADSIVDNAEGVFLWVALVLNIAVDGIDHGEAIQDIRTRIMSLPSELGELFSHILMQRIPSHHRTEAFGYLLIVLEWHLHRRPEQLPFLVVALGQQAKSYEAACSIASLRVEQMVRTSPEFDHERLESRCHGLLECHGDPECLRVGFLHRTLLDYLHEHDEVQAMLRSHAGRDFSVHSATMAGIIAHIGLWGHQDYVDRYLQGEDDSLCAHQLRSVFYFNVQAENFSGQAQKELLEILDDYFGKMNRSDNYYRRHWTYRLLGTPVFEEADLLAYTIYTGATLYLKSCDRISSTQADLLLYYAVAPFNHREALNPAINMPAAVMLLQQGASPTCVMYGPSSGYQSSAWSRVHTWLWMILRQRPWSEHAIPDLLDLIKWMFQYSLDKHACRVHAIMESTAGRTIRQLVLERKCCLGRQMQDCFCVKAKDWVKRARDALQMLESDYHSPPQQLSLSESNVEEKDDSETTEMLEPDYHSPPQRLSLSEPDVEEQNDGGTQPLPDADFSSMLDTYQKAVEELQSLETVPGASIPAWSPTNDAMFLRTGTYANASPSSMSGPNGAAVLKTGYCALPPSMSKSDDVGRTTSRLKVKSYSKVGFKRMFFSHR